jgi:hypothetical protein
MHKEHKTEDHIMATLEPSCILCFNNQMGLALLSGLQASSQPSLRTTKMKILVVFTLLFAMSATVPVKNYWIFKNHENCHGEDTFEEDTYYTIHHNIYPYYEINYNINYYYYRNNFR